MTTLLNFFYLQMQIGLLTICMLDPYLAIELLEEKVSNQEEGPNGQSTVTQVDRLEGADLQAVKSQK